MSFSELLNRCVNMGFETHDVNNVDISEIENFLADLDIGLIREKNNNDVIYFLDLGY